MSKQTSTNVWHRLGVISILILIGSTIVIFISVGFLAFLWYSNVENAIWKRIIINHWATRSISLTSIAIRTSTDLQAGVCLSILASLALEKFAVPLPEVAAV